MPLLIVILSFIRDCWTALFGHTVNHSDRTERIAPKKKLWKRGEGFMPFGIKRKGKEFHTLPYEEEKKNFACLAKPGQGKTVYFDTVMSTTFCLQYLTGKARALIYDVKGETEVLLKKHGSTPVLLNPLVKGSVGIKLEDFVKNPIDAERLALMFCRTSKPQIAKSESRYWIETSVNLLKLFILALVLRVNNGSLAEFTMRDVLNAIGLAINPTSTEFQHFISVLKKEEQEFILTTLLDERHGKNHLQSLLSVKEDWGIIAALDAQKDRRVGIDDWTEAWVLGFDQTAENLITPFNRFICDQLFDHLIMLENTPEERIAARGIDATYLFLDEGLSVIVPSFEELLRVGRSKGIRAFVTFLNLGILQEVLGEKNASGLLSYFRSIAVMGVSPEDAAYLSEKVIGYETVVYTTPIIAYRYHYDVIETQWLSGEEVIVSRVVSEREIQLPNHRLTWKERIVTGTKKEERLEPIVKAEELSQIAPPDKEGAEVFFYRPNEIAQKGKMTMKMLKKVAPLVFEKTNHKPSPPIDKSELKNFEIKPWTEEERRQLGIEQ